MMKIITGTLGVWQHRPRAIPLCWRKAFTVFLRAHWYHALLHEHRLPGVTYAMGRDEEVPTQFGACCTARHFRRIAPCGSSRLSRQSSAS